MSDKSVKYEPWSWGGPFDWFLAHWWPPRVRRAALDWRKAYNYVNSRRWRAVTGLEDVYDIVYNDQTMSRGLRSKIIARLDKAMVDSDGDYIGIND